MRVMRCHVVIVSHYNNINKYNIHYIGVYNDRPVKIILMAIRGRIAVVLTL